MRLPSNRRSFLRAQRTWCAGLFLLCGAAVGCAEDAQDIEASEASYADDAVAGEADDALAVGARSAALQVVLGVTRDSSPKPASGSFPSAVGVTRDSSPKPASGSAPGVSVTRGGRGADADADADAQGEDAPEEDEASDEADEGDAAPTRRGTGDAWSRGSWGVVRSVPPRGSASGPSVEREVTLGRQPQGETRGGTGRRSAPADEDGWATVLDALFGGVTRTVVR